MRSFLVAVMTAVAHIGGMAAAYAQEPANVYMSVNFGVQQPLPKTFSTVTRGSGGPLAAVLQTEYNTRNAPTEDIGGGVVVKGRLVAGLAMSRYTDSQRASLAFTMPNPIRPGPASSASLQSDPLDRTESGLHLQVGYAIPFARAANLVVFAGPSYMTVRQEVISNFNLTDFTYDWRTNNLGFKICCLQTEQQKASGWGYHAGADVSYFMTKTVGVGAVVRYARATVDMTNPILSSMRQRTVTDPIEVGGFKFGAGLRVRF